MATTRRTLPGYKPAIAKRNIAAERVRHDRNGREFELMDDLREVIDIGRHGIISIRRPGAIPMTAQIGGHDMPIGSQAIGHPVPTAAMILAAMQEQQRGRLRIAPIDVVQL